MDWITMKVIWNNQVPIGTGKIIEVLVEEKNWSRSTVQVLLSRLEERGFIECQKKGRLKYYIPLIEEEV
ncbi:MAG: BlaI/MecI/CopY family transcriptional regulator [Anaerocolumna sp.]